MSELSSVSFLIIHHRSELMRLGCVFAPSLSIWIHPFPSHYVLSISPLLIVTSFDQSMSLSDISLMRPLPLMLRRAVDARRKPENRAFRSAIFEGSCAMSEALFLS